MWYLLADANGLASGQTLVAGMSLIVPNKVTNIHNNAGTFRPYNPGEAMGDINPTLPTMPNPPRGKKGGCGGLGIILVAVVAIAATIITAGALAPVTASLGSGIAGTFATGVSVLGGSLGAAGFGIGLAAGAIGSVVGQLTGMALGVQDKFSWGAVATGAIGAGLGASSALGGISNQVVRAVAGNLINQGVGIITGAQKGFSWAGVAAAAIAAPITSKIDEGIKRLGDTDTASYVLRGVATGLATSTVNELTRVALVGGKLNWASVAIGGIQGGIYGYGEGLGVQAKIKANI